MASSLSNLVNNLSEGIDRIKCKFGRDDKKCESCGSKYQYCDCFLEYANFKHDLRENTKVCVVTKIINTSLIQHNDFLVHTNFLTTTMIILFIVAKRFFFLMSIRMIEKNAMKHRYLKKRFVTVT